jgi:hypothetical protein
LGGELADEVGVAVVEEGGEKVGFHAVGPFSVHDARPAR